MVTGAGGRGYDAGDEAGHGDDEDDEFGRREAPASR